MSADTTIIDKRVRKVDYDYEISKLDQKLYLLANRIVTLNTILRHGISSYKLITLLNLFDKGEARDVLLSILKDPEKIDSKKLEIIFNLVKDQIKKCERKIFSLQEKIKILSERDAIERAS